MKTKKQRAAIFLVLVPHRDIRFILRKYSAELFKAGFSGAFQFPWVVPAALLSSRLNEDELKHCACAYRETIGKEKITAAHGAVVEFSDGMPLFGPRLESPIPQKIFNESAAVKIVKKISPSVIGSCFLWEQGKTPLPVQKLSFRAAAFANMYWKPMQINTDGALGFKWKIGKLFWLPAV